MGVFQISPFDKGGMLYRPTETVAKTVGRDISPMAFAALYGWKEIGFHTTSVGLARPSDLEEVMDAVRLYSAGDEGDAILKATEERLNSQMEKVLGKEWMEKGLLNLPSCYDESTNGVAIGHILWCHDLITSFGMYEFAKARYSNMESFVKWDDKKTFDENVAKM
jgi:predicted aldo/keto reductase-like oxidoreductase